MSVCRGRGGLIGTHSGGAKPFQTKASFNAGVLHSLLSVRGGIENAINTLNLADQIWLIYKKQLLWPPVKLESFLFLIHCSVQVEVLPCWLSTLAKLLRFPGCSTVWHFFFSFLIVRCRRRNSPGFLTISVDAKLGTGVRVKRSHGSQQDG